jgi:hypothetical protein
MKRKLQTIAQFCADSPFSEHTVRWWVFQADHNGLAEIGAIIRIGRRVYLDSERFEDWINTKQARGVAA